MVSRSFFRGCLLATMFLVQVPLLAGKLQKAFKALEVHDYFKARELFRKEVRKHPAAAWYGLSVISGRANNPFFDLDSAYQFILKADLAFTGTPDKERVTVGALGVSHTSIQTQRDHIYDQAWNVARGQNTVAAYHAYLDRYPAGSRAEEARTIMYHLAFQEARSSNTAQSYERFIDRFPQAREVYEARTRLQDAVFEEATPRKDIVSFSAFIAAHPENPNVRVAEDAIFRLSTPSRTIAEYRAFITTFPDNHRVPDAWRSIYEVYSRDLSVGTITRFIAEYPEYPFMEELVDDYKTASLELLPFRREGKWGFIDTEGVERIKADHDWVEPFRSGQAVVSMNERVGTVNRTGRVVVPIEYDEVNDAMEGTFVVERANRFGAVDRGGDLVVDMVFTDLGDFSEGLAYAEDHGKYGYVNARGESVISAAYSSAASFHKGRAVVEHEGRYGVIDRSGMAVLPIEYDWVEGYEHGLSRVRKNGKMGVANVFGELVIQPMHDHIGTFQDGLALVVDGNRCGYVDSTGRFIVAQDYEAVTDVNTWGDFNKGHAEVRSGGKHGVIDTKGQRIIPLQYADVGGTSGPLFAVKKKNKWAFVDARNMMVVDARYDQVWDFVQGVARVKVGEFFGAIDTTGREVIPPSNTSLSDAQYGYIVGGSSRTGVYDGGGRLVIPAEHDSIVLISATVAKVTNGERSAYRSLSDARYIWKEEGFSVASAQ
ncbi:MAG: WG repeat-containing protein [Flavobacteriales bacterium]|nr:WG repeat-containing protein [Flavobacteriales bacterium]